jgi:hypothetical protein
MANVETLVLRSPDPDGDFVFRLAQMSQREADQFEQGLSAGAARPEQLRNFGPPLTLAQAMENLDTRDFRVLDVRRPQFQ